MKIEKWFLMFFKSGIFPSQSTEVSGNLGMTNRASNFSDHLRFKILSSKQMLQRLPTALAKVKAGNTSENLLNEICQMIYSLYPAKKVTEIVFSNIMSSTKVQYKMDTMFIYYNSENSKTSEPHKLLLNLADKINLKRNNKYVALSNLSLYYTWNMHEKLTYEKHTYKTNKFKI